MRRAFYIVLLLALATISTGLISYAGSNDGKTEALSSGLDDQTGVAITVYNVNLGLVKDRREIKLPKGTSDLRFMDIASKIIPTSVSIKSLVDPESLRILEQNYEYDLLNPQKLLDKYVGKEVKLYQKNPQ